MENKSLFEHAKDLDAQIRSIISHVDLDAMTHDERRTVLDVRRLATDARLDVRDYEYAQTRAEQLVASKEASERLAELHTAILKASEYNVFGAIDVAQLSALIDYLTSSLQ